MIQTFSFDIFGVSFFGRFIRSEVDMLFIYCYISLPILAVSGYAHKARKISFLRLSSILRISKCRCRAQIGYAIIVAHTVYMIHRAIRQISMHIEPSHSVRLALFALKEKSYVAIMVATAGYVANSSSLRHTFFPYKNACVWAIIKRVAQFFLSHAKPPANNSIRGIAW